MNPIKTHKNFEGLTQFWSHFGETTQTEMKFSSFIPKGDIKGCLIWLSGLTCTEENFITKAGAQRALAEHSLMVVCPDTSPRGLDLPAEHDSYDFGSGASFYLNATTEGYKDHYKMEDYICRELITLLRQQFSLTKFSLSGHSMGGHGALVLGLKNPDLFESLSAFSPIVNPCSTPWGQKPFRGYLGDEKSNWEEYDASLLVAKYQHKNPILIHQGTGDEFLDKELFPQVFKAACDSAGQQLQLRLQADYDHSYYFISSFIEDHIQHHGRLINFI